MPGMGETKACDCLVVGAGPAGLTAAIGAARSGLSVCILEKKESPGRKLLLTGGGHCNLTDPLDLAVESMEAFGRHGRSLRQALSAFDLEKFLVGLGVETEGGRRRGREHPGLPPDPVVVKGGARRMLEALLAECTRRGVRIETGADVSAARRLEGGGFEVETSRGVFAAARRLVIATGGITYSLTGSSGDGYALAESFGHTVEPPQPALAALTTSPAFRVLAGLSVPDAELALSVGGKRPVARTRGAVLFTHTGISGPAALDLSLELARLLSADSRVTENGEEPPETSPITSGTAAFPRLWREASVLVDFAPALSHQELVAELVARARSETKRSLENAGLSGLHVPARLGVELAERSGLDPRRRLGSLSERDFVKLAAMAKGLTVSVTEPLKSKEAMVTVGGVAMKTLDPRTMESRLVPGLRFAGEVLAPAGPCGGYNLLMAFATGVAAGR
jgi:predicted flavoprotein YhiN